MLKAVEKFFFPSILFSRPSKNSLRVQGILLTGPSRTPVHVLAHATPHLVIRSLHEASGLLPFLLPLLPRPSQHAERDDGCSTHVNTEAELFPNGNTGLVREQDEGHNRNGEPD